MPGDAASRPGPDAGARGRVSPWLLLVVPPLCWAGNFVIGRAMHADIPPMAFTFWRWMVAALVLAPVCAVNTWKQRALIRRHWSLIAALGITGVVAFQFFVYKGLQTTTAINGVLLMSTIPVVIPVFAYLLDGTRLARRQALGIAVSLAGVIVVVLRGDPARAASLHFTPGDLWVALAVPAWALYSVLVRRKPSALAPTTLLFATVLIGLAVLGPCWAWEVHRRGGFAATGASLGAILYVGVFASVVAFACWNAGVARVGAAKAGVFIHLMPVFAAVLAVVFLDERFYGYHLAGVAAIAAGLWLSSTTTDR